MKISEMSNEQLAYYEKQYLGQVIILDKESDEYANAHHRWMLLRLAGEQRAMWPFIPNNEELIKAENYATGQSNNTERIS